MTIRQLYALLTNFGSYGGFG